MNWDTFEKTARLYYRANQRHIEHLVSDSLAEIDKLTGIVRSPYLSLSGGKDSSLMLWLVRQVFPQIACLWVDEWDTADTHRQLDFIEAQWEHYVNRVRYRFHPEFFAHYGVQPNLCQDIRIDCVLDRFADFPPHYGWDACFVGMRMDESTNRWRELKDVQTRYLKGKQIIRCAPLAKWTLMDCWSYTLHHALPIHAGYSQMVDAGVEPKYARVGGLSIVRVYNYGTAGVAKRLWADDWNRMLLANPCMMKDA